jgi:hypothetical protein
VEVSFFLFHLTCGRGKGGGLVCFLKKKNFIVEGAREGGIKVLIHFLLKGEGRGRGGGFFFKIH